MRRETNDSNYSDMREHEVENLREQIRDLQVQIRDLKAYVHQLEHENEELRAGVVEEAW